MAADCAIKPRKTLGAQGAVLGLQPLAFAQRAPQLDLGLSEWLKAACCPRASE